MNDYSNTDLYITDDDGIWEITEWGKSLVEPSKEWFDKHSTPQSTQPEVSQEDLDKANRQIEILNTLMEVGLL